MTASHPASDAVEAILPLTPLQEGILFHCIASGRPGLYVTRVLLGLRGDLDIARWKQAWHSIAQRHQALRAAFYWEDRRSPVQVILRESRSRWRTEDASASEASPMDLLDGMAAGDGDFSLKTGELTSHCLFRLGDVAFLHIWSFHHVLLDGWSSQVVIRQVLDAYREPGAPPSPCPTLRDYLSHATDSANAESDRDFWRETLAEWPGATRLRQRPISLVHSMQSRQRIRNIGAGDCDALKRACRETRITLSTAVLGGWAAALAAFSGRDDVVIGVAHAGRDSDFAGIEAVVGLVMGTLPLRLRLEAAAPADVWLRNVQKSLAAAVRHDHLPAAELKRLAGLASGENLFECLFVFENVPLADADGGAGLVLESVEYVDRTGIPVALLVHPGEPLKLQVNYDEHLFGEAFVDEMLEAVERNVLAFAQDPKRPWRPCRDGGQPARRRYQAVAAAPTPDLPPVTDQIWARAARHTDAPALRCGDDVLSYGRLTERADMIARHLVDAGARRGSLIAVSLPTDPDAIAVILGVLRAGCAYVPIDPDAPAQRLETILGKLRGPGGTDDAPMIVVAPSDRRLAVGRADVATPDDLLRPDGGNGGIERSVAPEDLAYVMFTSGSTGVPKGVPVRHRHLSYSTGCRSSHYGEPPERFALLSPLFFDSSVAGIFWTLSTGGELVLAPRQIGSALEQVPNWIERFQITHTLCLPSLYSMTLSLAAPAQLVSLRRVILAGEGLPAAVVRAHRSAGLQASLHNEYGPTESTVWCTVFDVPRELDRDPVPIGQAIPGTALRIADEHLRPVPAGSRGEICITGPGVVDGYLGDPGLSGTSFVDASDQSGVRFYRTGDLGRVDEDGQIVFLGRADDQLKVQGRRVEPGEVESVIAGCAGVREVAVVGLTRPGSAGASTLVAFIAESSPVDEVALMARLQATLPPYLIPGAIHRVDAIPKLPNGKTDRRTLTRRLDDIAESGAATRDLDGASEAAVAAEWCAVLGMDRVGPDHDFFRLGGDSMSALLVLERINRSLGSQLSIADLYACPTVSGLARLAEQPRAGSDWVRAVPVRIEGSRAPLFLAYGNAHELAARLGPDQPVYWLIEGRGATVVPVEDFEVLALRHLEQVRAVRPGGPFRLAGFSLGALVVLELGRLLVQQGETVERMILIDPTRASLFRTRSRHARLAALLAAPIPSADKARYLLRFCARLPEFVADKASRAAARDPGVAPNLEFSALPAPDPAGGALTRDEILAMVRRRLERYPGRPYPGPIVLYRIDRGEQRDLEQRDEEVFWHEIAAGGLDLRVLRSDSGHRDLFRDGPALDRLCRLLELDLRTPR